MTSSIASRVKITKPNTFQMPNVQMLIHAANRTPTCCKVTRQVVLGDNKYTHKLQHTFSWNQTTVLGTGSSRVIREIIEAWYSCENSINRHIDLHPICKALRNGLQRQHKPQSFNCKEALWLARTWTNPWCELSTTELNGVTTTALSMPPRKRTSYPRRRVQRVYCIWVRLLILPKISARLYRSVS